MTTQNTFYAELARLEGERDATRGKLSEAVATLGEVLSFFPKNEGLQAITPEHAVHVRRVILDRNPTVADVYRWRQTLETLQRK